MPIERTFRAQITVEETWTKVTCNACGKEGNLEFSGQYIPGGFNLIRLSGGYGDDFPGDCERLEAVICSACTKAWADTWKVPPEMESYGFSSPIRQATHSETGEPWSVLNGVCWKGGEDQRPEWGSWDKIEEAEEAESAADYVLPEWNADEFWRFYGPPNSVWRHFKGNYYEVLYYPVCDTEGNYYIFYRALYGEGERRFLRPVEMWREHVEREGYSGPRFTLAP